MTTADAFFVLAFGSARVLKLAARRRGGRAERSPERRYVRRGRPAASRRPATRRCGRAASVRVLRLHASVFAALARRHPEVRTTFEALARTRALWNFFRIHAGFRTLPNEALAQLVAGLERVEVAAGALVIREGDPPGADVRRRGGPSAQLPHRGRRGAQPCLPPQGRRLRRARHCFSASRAPPPSRRSTTARCFALDPELFESLLADQPDFRSRIEERVLQYDYRRLARVPLDFADEILPAEVSAEEQHAAEELSRPSRSPSKSSEPLRRPSRPGPAAASRTSTSSTRWTAAPPVLRWYAASSVEPCPSATSGRSRTRARAGRR